MKTVTIVTWKKKTVCAIFCGLLFSVSAFATDIEGSIMVNGGFGIGALLPNLNNVGNSLLMGGRLQADYAVKRYISIGIESGFSTANVGNTDFSVGVIPIMARVAWHPFALGKLDPYIVGKAGYGIGFWTKEGNDYNWKDLCGGFVWGANLGIRFFFTESIGIFIEAGYECQCFDWDHPGMEVGKWDDAADGRTFAIIGLTLKFGGQK